MQYAAFVFAIFGFFAYLRLSSMKKRITELERQLSQVKGTSFARERASLSQAVRSCIGKAISIDLKEDHEDLDIVMYGNTRHGRNTVLDADDDWVLIRVESPKGVKDKLIRLESIQNIRMEEDA